jgi:formylglycine-generating enzyme required for sulfatase activity
VQDFIKKLNEKEKGKGYKYRLPSEAEWEYACRGGATSEQECLYLFYSAEPTNDLSSKEANFNGEFPFGKAGKGPFKDRTTKVGSYPPNKIGLYDMHGNVWQWCEVSDKVRVGGGSWGSHGIDCRAAIRYIVPPGSRDHEHGFRLARVAVQ